MSPLRGERHTCPRRAENSMHLTDGPFVGSGPDQDTWRRGTSFAGHEKDNVRSCSYCGSVNPDDFMAKIESGEWAIGPTDKNYKAYIGPALTAEELDDRRKRLPLSVPNAGVPHHDMGKFYFQHLNEEQRRKFLELLNARKLKIGYPGHFYRLPFFLTRGES